MKRGVRRERDMSPDHHLLKCQELINIVNSKLLVPKTIAKTR